MSDDNRVTVYSESDAEGLVEVIDDPAMRLLHLGSPHGQSAMILAEPERLAFAYARAVFAGLVFAPEPRRALVLGLGGGALAKFLLRNFPECRVEAVEARPAVAEVARRYFGLPDDPRLAVHIGDARQFVLGEAGRGGAAYDLIIVDIFDRDGMCGLVSEPDFLAANARLLRPEGYFALHAWTSRREWFWNALELLRRHYLGRTLALPIPHSSSAILYGFGPELKPLDAEALKRRAAELDARLGLELSQWLGSLIPADWVRKPEEPSG
jgi:spermidine synthase